MRKFIIALSAVMALASASYAAQLPQDLKSFVEKSFPKTDFRFDGVIILPDNTIYLPLLPAKFDKDGEFTVKTTFPANQTFAQKPDAVIFNNDFVLLKVLVDEKGNKTLVKLDNPPVEMRTGLLPQDMLVPRNLSVPANLKNITGNLEISTTKDTGLLVPVIQPKTVEGSSVASLKYIPELKGKTLYVSTSFSKNIQVVNPEKKIPEYALLQKYIPIMIKGWNDTMLLVSSFEKKSIDVISLADDKVIKQIELKSQPDEIIIDENNRIAYISAPSDASMYVVNLDTMTLKKQIKLNGMCEKIVLSDDGTKIFYYDKQTSTIWVIETDNSYLLREIGKFPNVSKIAYLNNKIYITSRTKNKLAIVDYETMNLLSENSVSPKPVDMLGYGNNLFILGAAENTIEVVDTSVDKLTDTIVLPTNGFSTKLNRIDGTNLALVTDAKAGKYFILNLETKTITGSNPVATPVTSLVVLKKVKKIGAK